MINAPLSTIAGISDFLDDPGFLTAAGMIPVFPKGIDKLDDVIKLAKAGEKVAKTGHWHHAISMKIYRALQQHPNLKDVYGYRDSRFVTQAIDLAAHRGYQSWHRQIDKEVAEWIKNNARATKETFEQYLREVYKRPELLKRFPDALP